MGARGSSPVVVVRAILLLLAAGAATAAFILTRQEAPRGLAAAQRRYACPMHREVTSAVPGHCPICGMALSELPGGQAIPPAAEARVARRPGVLDTARRRIVSSEVRGPAWVQQDGAVRAVLYRDEIATLAPGERGVFRPASAAGTGLEVRLGGAPAAPWDESTSTVDFRLEGARTVAAGTTGWVELAARPREVLVVPSSAVLQSPDGPYVLVASGGGRAFTRRQVAIGRTLFGFAAIVAGLRENERIAARGAFFLDGEQRLGGDADSGAVEGR
jgi:hypothetical protein